MQIYYVETIILRPFLIVIVHKSTSTAYIHARLEITMQTLDPYIQRRHRNRNCLLGFVHTISLRFRAGFLIGSRSIQTRDKKMEHEMEHEESGAPILCVNNCGFFGSAATMNMCSKCHKDMILKQKFDGIVNGGLSAGKQPVVVSSQSVVDAGLLKVVSKVGSELVGGGLEIKPKEGPSRCNSCRKKVGLTGFSCRCGHVFCAAHRYSDKHDCQFDYRTAGREAIAKANPIVKAHKLDKI